MEEKFICRTTDTLFYNSQALLIEYHDCLKSPWFVALKLLTTNIPNSLKSFFDFSEFMGMDTDALYEWYVTRKHRNFFKNIPLLNKNIDLKDEWFDELLEVTMNSDRGIYEINSSLNFYSIINRINLDGKLIKKIIIFSDLNDENIRSDIEKLFGDSVEYRGGNFKDIIMDIPQDSTFVLSDVSKIEDLSKIEKLEYSSILISDGYRYNYLENDLEKLKCDVDQLLKKNIFKINFFNNLYEIDNDADENPEELPLEDLFPKARK